MQAVTTIGLDIAKSVFQVHDGYRVTVRGFRTSFRTWARDTHVPFDVGGLAIAHKVGNHAAQAYLDDGGWSVFEPDPSFRSP